MDIIIFLAIGAVAGWLAGAIMDSPGFGIIGNIIIGVLGAIAGGFVLDLFNIPSGGFITLIATATVGAALLLYLVKIVKR